MVEYLYGASIQGIQEYIYATNDLQEIIGASEIIDSLGRKFKDKKDVDGAIFGIFDELREKGFVKQILLNAAGNFRAIVEGEDNLQKIVRDLPKKIMQNAYGITISQAAVPYDGDYEKASKELEKNLKIQRNRPSIPLDMSINFIALAPKTARPIVEFSDGDASDSPSAQNVEATESAQTSSSRNKKEGLDISSVQKRDAYKRSKEGCKEKEDKKRQDNNFTELKKFSDISNDKNKLAVIHADGNGLGVLVKNLIKKVKENNEDIGVIAEFSEALDEATKEAFDEAKNKIIKLFGEKRSKIRKLILSGDDMTAVCDADIALEFTKNFIEEFENETDKKKPAIEQKLTMCAGIAYCNEKFPFHYAVGLAEELCSAAKKHSKNKYVENQEKDIAPSCLMFHNVQSSNFQSWDKFIKDELTIGGEKGGCMTEGEKMREIGCDFGPYYLSGKDEPHAAEPQIEDFINLVEIYRGENSPKGKLREWIKELGINDKLAKSMLDRINEMLENKGEFDKALSSLYGGLKCENLILEKDGEQKTPIYDILQFLSVTSGVED